jgi:hypothetical protein
MKQQGKRGSDTTLLLALACGATVENAARQVGLSESTVYRRLANPEFRTQLQAIRDEMVRRSAGMLTAASTEAIKTLLSLQSTSTPPAVRLGAARAVLEIGMNVRAVSDLTERLSALEAHFASQGTLLN